MREIKVKNVSYKIHPVFDLYAADRNGNIININRKVPIKGNKIDTGYLKCMVRRHNQKVQKTYRVHRFIWECFNGIIPEGMVIDHIDDNKENNRLSNLQLLTPKQNSKKSAKNRNYSFVANNHKNRKNVKATNVQTNEITYYNSTYAVQQHLSISNGTVNHCCQGKYGYKHGISKNDRQRYKFEFVKEEEMPDNYIKSKDIRQKKLFDKRIEIWCNLEYICSKCNQKMKNGNRYFHNC